MAKITVELVRRRAEHNNCEISTLEELSLHQQDLVNWAWLDRLLTGGRVASLSGICSAALCNTAMNILLLKIEHLDRWCKCLKILYLQNNLIGRIENVGRLKQLQYLNLAINNIEKVENLSNCEFLDKLDLTLNFIGDLLSVESLARNVHLRDLYLTGNPCTDYHGYRDFVVAVLPQITSLDGTEVTKSERILASQKVDSIRREIVAQQEEYKEKRSKEKADHEQRQAKKKEKKPGFDGRWYTDTDAHVAKDGGDKEPEEDDDEFWQENVPYTPESRTETLLHIAEKKKETPTEPSGPEQLKRVRRLEMDGKMLNVNEGRYEFHLTESEDDSCLVLDVAVPRFMDTSLVDCDVQPSYIRATIKGKILQLVLPDEVSPDQSSAQRSQTTGHLLITMPKAGHIISGKKKTSQQKYSTGKDKMEKPSQRQAGNRSKTESCGDTNRANDPQNESCKERPELLEVDPSVRRGADFANIVRNKENDPPGNLRTAAPLKKGVADVGVSEDFVDDPDVPPLI